MLANRMVRYLLFFLVLLTPALSHGQQTQVYVDPDAQYRNALDLFEKQKYSEAEDAFDRIVAAAKDKNNLLVVDAQYYAALCALELFHKDAEIRLKQFLADHPESPKCRKVKFQLGRYNYRKKDYKDELAWFAQVEIYDLQPEELSEYYFKRGYAHYELGHIDSAKKDFYEIKDLDSKYSPAANYYYSHISYTQGNYETALQGFQKLSGNETFGPVVPYYVAQIYFLQSRYNDVISYAPPLLDSAKRAPEIADLIGLSYYRTNRYKEAIPFLERHRKGVSSLTRNEAYELGYAYYKTDSCGSAIDYFQQAISDSSDALAQNSWYHLADCYLKGGNKMEARDAFIHASKMKFDPVIREDALFNSARLSYELDFSPFNEAIIALNEYLKEYPNTPRHDEAYSLLTNVYLSSHNYKEALESIEKIKNLSPLMQPTYQKIAYNYGIQLYNNKSYDEAQKNFDKSLTYPVSRELNSLAHYWKAESWYAKASEGKGDTTLYHKAVEEYKVFLYTPGATQLPNYNTANYDIGYCYFQAKDWSNSMLWFRKYIASKTPADSDDRIFDAYLRLGDGYFRLEDYLNSAEFYGKAVDVPKSNNLEKDYAMFQEAMALGYQGKKKEKADLLKKLRETYPQSYVENSRYQEARTLHDLRMYDEALAAYNDLYNFTKDKSSSPYPVLCLKNMGLIYRAKGDLDNAMTQYKKAVDLVKTTKGSDLVDLMHEIKDIYISKGQLDQWETYAESMGFSESEAVADSTTYVVAVKFYKDGNCTEGLKQFNKYIQKYPNGIHITEIQYMRAECSFKNTDFATALQSYNAVLDKGNTKYTEWSLYQTAYIYYKQADYANAVQRYGRLERESSNSDYQNAARIYLMRSYMNLNNADSAGVYAEKVVKLPKLTNEESGLAHYFYGKLLLNRGDRTKAEEQLKAVETALPQTNYAAEARYLQCLIHYENKDYKATQKMLLKEINDYAGYSQWSGKGWLLLADDYLALKTKKDTFQAKVVLKNYIDNGDVPELVQQAKDKLSALEEAGRPSNERKPDDLIIPLDPKNPGEGEGNSQGGGQ